MTTALIVAAILIAPPLAFFYALRAVTRALVEQKEPHPCPLGCEGGL
jgi:hypothetical protein